MASNSCPVFQNLNLTAFLKRFFFKKDVFLFIGEAELQSMRALPSNIYSSVATMAEESRSQEPEATWVQKGLPHEWMVPRTWISLYFLSQARNRGLHRR